MLGFMLFPEIIASRATLFFVRGDSGMELPTLDKGVILPFVFPVEPLGLA